MKLKDLGHYLIIPAQTDEPERYLRELKGLEWIFIAVRWVWVPLVFLMAWLHHPARTDLMIALGAVVGLYNLVASWLNAKIGTLGGQRMVGLSMLVVDTLLTWGGILLFVRDFYTAAYAGFIFVILQGALRFGIAGSLAMALVFVLGLYGAFLYREAAFGVRFSTSGYAFWTALMSVVSVSVGMIVNEGRRQRRQSEIYLRENALLSERHRIARELHDTVLKTLQGLALEARALGNRATSTPSLKETAQYIEEVCSRTSREIREVVLALRSENIAVGIGEQLSGMLNEWERATGIECDFELSGEDPMLPPESARQVRNIVGEALTNIQRHAAASRVRITLNTSGDTLDVQIGDNGHGIGRSADDLHVFLAEGKLGIAGMKERVELLGGCFSLSSDQGATVIKVNVPVRSRADRMTDEPNTRSHS